MDNSFVNCDNCGRLNRKSRKCNNDFNSVCINHSYWRPSPKFINYILSYPSIKIQRMQLALEKIKELSQDDDIRSLAIEGLNYNELNIQK